MTEVVQLHKSTLQPLALTLACHHNELVCFSLSLPVLQPRAATILSCPSFVSLKSAEPSIPRYRALAQGQTNVPPGFSFLSRVGDGVRALDRTLHL